MNHLSIEISNGVAEVALKSQPENRWGALLIDELEEVIRTVGRKGIRAALVRVEGPHLGVGDADVCKRWTDIPFGHLRLNFQRYLQVFNQFERLPIPVIAAVQGLCFGSGLELALRADMIFASATSSFGHPEQCLGMITLLGGTYRMADKAGRARAAEWALTPDRVPAATMERFGVVNRVVDDAPLLQEARDFVGKIAIGPTRAFAAHKSLLRAWATAGTAAADGAMLDIVTSLFESYDLGPRGAVDAQQSLAEAAIAPITANADGPVRQRRARPSGTAAMAGVDRRSSAVQDQVVIKALEYILDSVDGTSSSFDWASERCVEEVLWTLRYLDHHQEQPAGLRAWLAGRGWDATLANQFEQMATDVFGRSRPHGMDLNVVRQHSREWGIQHDQD